MQNLLKILMLHIKKNYKNIIPNTPYIIACFYFSSCLWLSRTPPAA